MLLNIPHNILTSYGRIQFCSWMKRIPCDEWIVEYSYLHFGFEIYKFFRGEKTDDGLLRISAIVNFQQFTDLDYDEHGKPDPEDDVDERTAEIMNFRCHDNDDDALSDVGTVIHPGAQRLRVITGQRFIHTLRVITMKT